MNTLERTRGPGNGLERGFKMDDTVKLEWADSDKGERSAQPFPSSRFVIITHPAFAQPITAAIIGNFGSQTYLKP